MERGNKFIIYITRDEGTSIVSRGLGNVYVWFHEPYLVIRQTQDTFSEESDDIHNQLKGILYTKNHHLGYVYRESRDYKSGFGDMLVKQGDNLDMHPLLLELKKDYKVRFSHEVHNGGRHSGYHKNKVSDIFGHDSDIAKRIWEIVIEEFQGDEKEVTDESFRNWEYIENDKPWWRFCKKLEIEISLA